ncbi:hypothetical protein JCM10908_006250 [Rhodotorula pacifica]|uniref:Vms1p n=1 Tax=Rhodotorula pacifica TaxID=1495444 RepID=UPI00317BF56F
MAYTLPRSALYAFQLPPELINALQPRQLVIPPSHPLHPSNRQQDAQENEQEKEAPLPETSAPLLGGAYTCALTGASFSTLEGLKQHYRTDWYRYNVKLKLQGKKTPVSEQQFNQMVENLTESISGSEASTASDAEASTSFSDSDSDSHSNSGANLTRLLRKQHLSHAQAANAHDDEDNEDLDVLASAGPRTALQWFEAPSVAQDTQYGVHRAALPLAGGRKRALPGTEEGLAVLHELKELQLRDPAQEEEQERKWTLLMFGGGHFAGMVVSLRPKLVKSSKKGSKEKEREVVVLHKKTFHRYTTRRKQGGSQGANDSANGKAKSAGAQIRRYNEAMLTDEVRALLDSWSEEIQSSELVFLRCSKNNYKTFFGYSDEAPLKKGDPRIRGFGFPTKRPTINELMRAFMELTRFKTSHLTADALAQLDADYFASIAPLPSRPSPASVAATAAAQKDKEKAPAPPKLTKEEELERDRWTRLVGMVKKGRVEALSTFLDKYGPELESGHEGAPWGTLPAFLPEAKATPTLLHLAAASGQPAVVRYFLSPPYSLAPVLHETHLPPHSPRSFPTPYEIASDRPTRNEFRFAAFRDPDRCDWTGSGVGGARVPGGLDEEKEREKERKEEEKRAKLRERQRERDEAEAQRLAIEEEQARQVREKEEERRRLLVPPGPSGPQRLGGGPPAPIRERQQAGLSEEQKMRIQREERARAAEARLKRLGG